MVVGARAGGAQLLLQRGDVRAEISEVADDRHAAVGGDEEPVRLALMTVSLPEDLCDRDAGVVATGRVNAQDHWARTLGTLLLRAGLAGVLTTRGPSVPVVLRAQVHLA